MKKIALICCVAVLAASCQFISFNGKEGRHFCKGPVETRVLDSLSGFNAITVSGHADVTFIQGEEYSVEVNANNDVFEHLDYSVQDGCLLIKTRGQIYAKTYDVTVTAPVLEKLTVKGATDFSLKNYSSDENIYVVANGAAELEMANITVPGLSIQVNGAGDVDMDDIKVGSLGLTIKGAGDVTVSGTADAASISVSGAGDIDATELVCPEIKTHKSGAASIRLSK
jgi:hypothetical protein